MEMTNTLQFELPAVRVDNSVWTWLSREKLENMKLSTSAIRNQVHVSREPFSGKSRLVVSREGSSSCLEYSTVIHNTNTAKDFREIDRKGMFNELLELGGSAWEQRNVYLVSFADLKTYIFTFNVGFPTLGPLDYEFTYENLCFSESTRSADEEEGVYILREDGSSVKFSASCEVKTGDCLVIRDSKSECFSPGLAPWYMRDILTSIALRIDSEIIITVLVSVSEFRGLKIRPTKQVRVVASWVKWPLPIGCGSGLTAVQSVDLKRYLDPVHIAAEAVQLNVKLIKWRLIPSLEPERMSSLRCLLIGAGTLGCAVARCLLAWGVSRITLIDSGRVSYSNPARQWLFRLEDAIANAPKASTAAARLREIHPCVEVEGVDLAVPLPGHPADLEDIETNFEKLNDLVSSHDVVFTLTDSRESRWLPTLLVAGAPRDKQPMGIAVALGFDSYLVKLQSRGEAKSACYFCNDVSAPSDQTMFRTLDQMCTVTRPGLAAIASCVAVELLASLSQADKNSIRTVEDSSLLGSTPDQIRGFLSNFQSFPAITEPFRHCICCSEGVLSEFKRNGIEMVKKAVSNSSYLMELSGLSAFNEKGEDLIADVFFPEEDQQHEENIVNGA